MRADLVRSISRLLWGLFCYAGFMGLVSFATLTRALVPSEGTEGVPFSAMPWSLALLNLSVFLLPVAVLVLIPVGWRGLMASHPGVGPRVTWRLGPGWVGPHGILVLLFVALFLGIGTGIVLGFAIPGLGGPPATGLFVAAVVASLSFSAGGTTIGWFLIFASARALEPMTTPREASVVRVAVLAMSFLALLLVGAQATAAIVRAPTIMESQSDLPPFVPWAEIPAALGGFTTTALLSAVARRARARLLTFEGVSPSPPPPPLTRFQDHQGPGKG